MPACRTSCASAHLAEPYVVTFLASRARQTDMATATTIAAMPHCLLQLL
jgi:hypothetical protein